ncbi:hypothetical protein LPJ53_002254 [Coemansia erecta]|uniref:Uncharacterized protein n=1 Tax=Coemansia erecta TaxID=147472 RepID=A0A9W7Y4M2_9FUNG|nr:hypothetical protein LPJ53_002254 [Coemansia erecta]
MSKFVPFNGKGLMHFNHVDGGYLCTFCGNRLATFALYESHWPKCTGVCKEWAFKPSPMTHFHSAAKDSKGAPQAKPAAKGPAAKGSAAKGGSANPAPKPAPASAPAKGGTGGGAGGAQAAGSGPKQGGKKPAKKK